MPGGQRGAAGGRAGSYEILRGLVAFGKGLPYGVKSCLLNRPYIDTHKPITTHKGLDTYMVKNFYNNADVLDVAVGSFSGMAGLDLKNKVQVERQGTTFAVSTVFPYLSLTRFLSKGMGFSECVNRLQGLSPELSKPIKVILPSSQASQLSGLTRVSALGGAEHELGHIIIDMGGTYLPNESELKTRGVKAVIEQFQSHPKHDVLKTVLHTWVNVLADVRLERFMGAIYEPTRSRFHAVQTWVHDLESQGRSSGKFDLGGAIMCIVRDLGKGWTNPIQQAVLKEYQTLYPQAWQLAQTTKAIWSKVIPSASATESDVASSVHLPLVVAMQLLMALADVIEKQEQQKGDGQSGDDDDDSQGGDDDSQGDDQGGDKKGKDGQGGDDDKGKGKGQGDDKDKKDGQGGDDKDKGQGKGQGKKGGKLGLDDLLKGEALDPSSAMAEAVKRGESKVNHKVYYDNVMREKAIKF